MSYLFEYKNGKKDYINASKLLCRTTQRLGYWLPLILTGGYMIYLYSTYGKYLLQGYQLSVGVWFLLILYPFVVAFFIFSPWINGMRREKQRRYKGVFRACFDDNGITSDTELDHAVTSYQSITQICHWRETYYLFLGKNSVWILPERGLIEGDLAGFGAYLEQKTGLTIKKIK